MEATALVKALGTLRSSFETPPSDLEIIRQTLLRRVAEMGGIEMPPLLTHDQRKLFTGKIDLVQGFLETEDGADAVELLIGAFLAFEEKYNAPAPAEPAPAPASAPIPVPVTDAEVEEP